MRRHDEALALAARELRVTPEQVPEQVAQLRGRVRELERGAARASEAAAFDLEQLLGGAYQHDGATVLASAVPAGDGKALLQILDRLKGNFGDAAIVLGAAGEDRVDLVVSVSPALVERGLHREIVKAAAEAVGGGGGGRDTMARAGGRDVRSCPKRCGLRARRSSRPFLGSLMRVLALDYGSARCGCAVSDPTGVLATPIETVANPGSRQGWLASVRSWRSWRPSGWWWGSRSRCRVRTPRRRTRRAGSRIAWLASCPCRSSSTKSGSRPGRPSAAGGGRARTHVPPRTCSRAGWRLMAQGRAMADGRERTEEEREAARLERERRRAAQAAPAPEPAGPKTEPEPEPAPALRARWRFGCPYVNRFAIVRSGGRPGRRFRGRVRNPSRGLARANAGRAQS